MQVVSIRLEGLEWLWVDWDISFVNGQAVHHTHVDQLRSAHQMRETIMLTS
jgi:hypothetical protein